MAMNNRQALETLGVIGKEPGDPVSKQEVTKAYHKLALKQHPDKGGNEETFKKVSEAYGWLQQRFETNNGGDIKFPPKPEPPQESTNPRRAGSTKESTGAPGLPGTGADRSPQNTGDNQHNTGHDPNAPDLNKFSDGRAGKSNLMSGLLVTDLIDSGGAVIEVMATLLALLLIIYQNSLNTNPASNNLPNQAGANKSNPDSQEPQFSTPWLKSHSEDPERHPDKIPAPT